MKPKILLVVLMASLSFTACGQSGNKKSTEKTNTKTEQKMDLLKLTNENVKQAIEALQANNKTAWFSYFTDDAVFTDDGNTRDFKAFFDNAFNHKEHFLSIDKVENNGLDITGNFYAGQWGTFKVYFKFHQNENGKFDRLDIGQVSK